MQVVRCLSTAGMPEPAAARWVVRLCLQLLRRRLTMVATSVLPAGKRHTRLVPATFVV